MSFGQRSTIKKAWDFPVRQTRKPAPMPRGSRMSTEIIPQQQGQSVQVHQWTPAQMSLITDTIAKGATKDELQLFLYRCQNMGLDPLKPGQIHFIKYGNSAGTIVIGIEGFRSIAGRSGKHVGTKRGVLRNDKGQAIGGWAEVFRSDWKEPAKLEVSLAEYNKGSGPWKSMPESMIQKVAEAGALRMAFPDDLGGVYSQEEMDQAGEPSGGVHPEQPGPDDGDREPRGWTFSFGQWRDRTVEQVYNDPKNGPERLKSYVVYLEESAQKKGEQLSPRAQEAIDHICSFIGAMENEPLEVETKDDLPF